jgi:peptidoglycan hydrolase-like protein with peptidoglycan-binding domain
VAKLPINAGSDANSIGELQGALVAKGYSTPTNGIFDKATIASLEAFQDDNALLVQPSCDAACWQALQAKLAAS